MNEHSALACMAVLANPGRLRLFQALISVGQAGATIDEIVGSLDLSAATAVTQLEALDQAGLILKWRDSGLDRYAINVEHVRGVYSYLLSNCCDGHPERCGSFIEQFDGELKRLAKPS